MTGKSRTALRRRRLLEALAAAVPVGLAGCTGSGNGGGGTTTRTGSNGSDGGDGHDHGTAEHDHGGSLGEPAESAEISMVTGEDGTHFEPHVVRVTEGGTVTWVNESGSHSATAYAPANDRPRRIPEDASSWDSGVLRDGGATFEHTFETAGVYDFFCRPHESTGMIGSVIVGEPEPGGQPGLAEPQRDLPEAARSKIADLNDRVQRALGGGGEHTATTDSGGHGDGHDH